MDKVKKIQKIILAAVILLSAGALLGSSLEREYRKRLDASAEYIDTIAIVNMDEGAIVEDNHINYASQLIQIPGDNYVTAGLNEAKMGIENGTYAAYIVIPGNFSEAVVSVRNHPEKIVLEYAFNQKLDEKVEKQAIYDVNTFESMLNTNIAYMYLDAILAAFHDVQDHASAILHNDIDELVQLQEVDSGELIVPLEQPEMSIAANEIEQVNLTPYLTQNETAMDTMEQEYHTSIQQGIDEFANVKSGHEAVTAASSSFLTAYETVVRENDAQNAEILADGKDKIEDAVAVFNQNLPTDLSVIETQIAQLLEKQRIADEIAANEQMAEMRTAYADLQTAWNMALQEAFAENEPDGEEEWIVRPDVMTVNTAQGKITLEPIEDAGAENIRAMAADFAQLFAMEDDRQTVANVIQSEVFDKLEEAQQGQMDKLTAEEAALNTAMTDYEKNLSEYDPFQYLNMENMNEHFRTINQNTADMFDKVEENNAEYAQYADDVYAAASEDAAKLQNTYYEMGEQTAGNVADCILVLQASRESVNSQNTAMLQEFTGLLEYTRVGSQKNTEAYGHIVSPVTALENGAKLVNPNAGTGGKGISDTQILTILLLSGAAAGIISLASYIRNRRTDGDMEEEGEEII